MNDPRPLPLHTTWPHRQQAAGPATVFGRVAGRGLSSKLLNVAPSLRETIITTERRLFARVAFAAGAGLITTQAHLQCQVVDISLKGVLLQLPAGTLVQVGMPCLVRLPLGEGEAGIVIAMAGELAHVEGDHAGVQCRSIDLESITHLRRLIEINLGDPSASERELKALIAAARQA